MIEWLASKSFRRLRSALQALRGCDFAQRIPVGKMHGAERELAEEMNDVVTAFRKKMLDQERHYGQYEALINTIDSALIVCDADGGIRFMNRKAIDGLCGFRINHISALASLNPDFPSILLSLEPGQSKMVPVNDRGKETRLKASMVRFASEGEDTLLFSIESVDLLMMQNEIDAQRKLVSVLTHEIMNSLSPIISLSETLYDTISCPDEETKMALSAIKRRSAGLLAFVEKYRDISQIAPPKLGWTKIGELFDELRGLYPAPYIDFGTEDAEMHLLIDRQQIMHVLINLLKNAIEACGDDPRISVASKADLPSRRFVISVSDNGPGIAREARDKIFVPFYTTKSGGSGIGLSLSRQIVNMHGGVLKLGASDTGSEFLVILPCVYRI